MAMTPAERTARWKAKRDAQPGGRFQRLLIQKVFPGSPRSQLGGAPRHHAPESRGALLSHRPLRRQGSRSTGSREGSPALKALCVVPATA
jgi:hypothetical protein